MVRALVVDDDGIARRDVLNVLMCLGVDCDETESAMVAETLLEQCDYDLLVIDDVLEGESGYELCRRVRSVSDVPVVMLSDIGSDAYTVLGFEAGADDYLVKPFCGAELSCRIRAVMKRSKMPKMRNQSISA